MSTFKTIILFALIALANQSAFSANGSTGVTVNKYAEAVCQDFTGTWQGFITEEGNTFKKDVSSPITVSLYSHENKLIGQNTTADMFKDHHKLWADCKDGVLSNIFWGNKASCGGYSQEGILVNKDVLVLKLHFETQKEDTYFLAFLHKENNKYPHSIPTKAEDFTLGNIKTCH